MSKISRFSLAGSLFVLLFFCCLSLHSQSTEPDIKARLSHKPLYLRGCWRENNLIFDAAGRLQSAPGVTSVTLCGYEFKKLSLTNDKLLLEGRRIGLELVKDTAHRVPLNAGTPDSPVDVPIHVEIAATPTGDYSQALDAVFANSLADLSPSLPFFWKPYSEKHFLSAGTNESLPEETASASSAPKIYHAKDPGIKPPKLLHSAFPEYSDAARRLRYSGEVTISGLVTPEGKFTNLTIEKALGMGLDERALAAIQQYTFSPGTLDGNPVTVQLEVKVLFSMD